MKTMWNYTKNVILDNKSIEDRVAMESVFFDANGPQDWYYDQVEAGLADPLSRFLPVYQSSDTVWEHLVTDQVQADSYIAMAYAVAERIGCPLNGTVVDVDYTTDTIPDDFIIS